MRQGTLQRTQRLEGLHGSGSKRHGREEKEDDGGAEGRRRCGRLRNQKRIKWVELAEARVGGMPLCAMAAASLCYCLSVAELARGALAGYRTSGMTDVL
jgi:hypothetical protein